MTRRVSFKSVASRADPVRTGGATGVKSPLKKFLMLGVAAYAVVLAFSYFLAPAILIRPTREAYDLSSAPMEIRENSDEVEIQTEPDFTVRGTLVPGSVGRPLVILIPDLGHSRGSVMDRAVVLAKERYPVLALDPRGQGQSDGRYCTLGFRETDDIHAAIDFMSKRDVAGGEGVILYGVEGGASVAALEASTDSRVIALILESPFASLRDALIYRACLSGILPGFLAALPVDIMLKATADMVEGFDAKSINVESLVSTLQIPVLLIHGDQGERFPGEGFDRIFHAMRNPQSQRLIISGPSGRPWGRPSNDLFQAGLSAFLKTITPPNQ
jgi:pimeloyl-ACP methyl ester carboxylesterase